MTENECLSKMVPPGQRRPGKFRGGVIQVWVTRACDKACFNCTQGSNLGGKPGMITVENFELAVKSLKGYDGVVGMFGGNPALHPQFEDLCRIMREHVPYEQRGLWCNNPRGKGKIMAETFNPAVSNLNVHLDREAYDEFRRDWPACKPFGLETDSRHSPVYVAMRDLEALPTVANITGKDKVWRTMMPNTEENRHELIARCDINQHWSAMIGQFRGQVRAWFCEIAGAQAMLHQHNPNYPDSGMELEGKGWQWWRLPMQAFAGQVRQHCHDCGVPLKGYGELACAGQEGKESVSLVHLDIYKPKVPGRTVVTVTSGSQMGHLDKTTDYVGNAKR